MAATANRLKVTLPSDREVMLVREFDAPRNRVWDACTMPDLVKQWWGPLGTSLTICEIDLRPGGIWRFVSRADDGTEHPFTGVYREITAPERVVQTSIYDVPPFNEFEAIETMTLNEHAGRTTLTTIVLHQSMQARDGYIQSGMEKGAGETFDRLEELLAATT